MNNFNKNSYFPIFIEIPLKKSIDKYFKEQSQLKNGNIAPIEGLRKYSNYDNYYDTDILHLKDNTKINRRLASYKTDNKTFILNTTNNHNFYDNTYEIVLDDVEMEELQEVLDKFLDMLSK